MSCSSANTLLSARRTRATLSDSRKCSSAFRGSVLSAALGHFFSKIPSSNMLCKVCAAQAMLSCRTPSAGWCSSTSPLPTALLAHAAIVRSTGNALTVLRRWTMSFPLEYPSQTSARTSSKGCWLLTQTSGSQLLRYNSTPGTVRWA